MAAGIRFCFFRPLSVEGGQKDEVCFFSFFQITQRPVCPEPPLPANWHNPPHSNLKAMSQSEENEFSPSEGGFPATLHPTIFSVFSGPSM